MIKVKITHTKKNIPLETKDFNDEKEMLQYGLNKYPEIIISASENFDYKMEIYDYYRE